MTTDRSAPPVATYRVQLRREFTFADLADQVDYLAVLGVSHVYLSPILQATPGSAHGYDVVDHARLADDLGGEPGFATLRRQLDRHGVRAVADVVPNHMAMPTPQSANRQLWSVLHDGPGSPYATWFDVDWRLGGGRMLLPVLGRHLADCLADGELRLDPSGSEPVVRYHDAVFPVRPGTEQLPLADLLGAQWYALSYWRTGSEDLNYRRFFDVTTLLGVRVEDAEVFAATHAALLDLIRDGALTGLRVDHPDGLSDPEGYLRRLAEATSGGWVVVEKILEGDEALPASWQCAGTTGYDAVQRIGGVFLDPAGGPPLTELYTSLAAEPADFETVATAAKRQVLDSTLAAEVARLVAVLTRITTADPLLSDHSRRALQEVIVELLVAFPVYRAYVVPGEPPTDISVRVVGRAVETARARLPGHRHGTLELVHDLVLGRRGRHPDKDEFVVRFQQTCGPAMAKGVEDTAFYRWFRLSSLNEVGGDPSHFGVTPADFHVWCAGVQAAWPAGLTTLSTHDTKRSEDARARLAVLSELPAEWAALVAELRAASAAYRPALLDANTEYLLWQTLVGVGPVAVDRLTAYLEKATREAKRYTSWVDPDPVYDDAIAGFTRAAAADPEVVRRVGAFVERLSPYFRVNVLGQKLVQLTAPGVPDVYQGSELVTLSLVDPDNRAPVNYVARRSLLDKLDAGQRADSLDAEKLLVVSRALRLRRAHPEAYVGTSATYRPLPTGSDHAIAFCRGERAVTVATRLPVSLERAGGLAAGGSEGAVELPPGTWTDALTGAAYDGGRAPLAAVLRELPVALLVSDDGG